MSAALLLWACNFDMEDIPTQESEDLGAERAADAGLNDRRGMDGGVDEDPQPPIPDPDPDPDGDDDAPDPPPPDADPEPEAVESRDAGADDGGEGDPSGPCDDGMLECVPVSGTILGDLLALPGGQVRYSADGYDVTAVSDTEGNFRVWLPADTQVLAQGSAPGFMDSLDALYVPPTGTTGVVVWLYSDEFAQSSVASLGLVQDWNNGIVVAAFAPLLSGAGMTIDGRSDAPWVWAADGSQVFSDRLLPNGRNLISWTNVEPQPLRLTPFGPPGTVCEQLAPDIELFAAPRTVTGVLIRCRAVAQ